MDFIRNDKNNHIKIYYRYVKDNRTIKVDTVNIKKKNTRRYLNTFYTFL